MVDYQRVPLSPVKSHLRLVRDEESPEYDAEPSTESRRMSGFGITPSEVYAIKNAYALATYSVLAKHANAAGECWPSVETIAEGIGATPPTVRKALKHLADAGILTVIPRTANGMDQANAYRLHFHNSANRRVETTFPPVETTFPLGRNVVSPGTKPGFHEQDSREQDSREQEVNPPSPQEHSTRPTYPEWFETIWTAYPSGHGSKKKTYEAARRHRLGPDAVPEVLAGIDRWKQCERWAEGFIKDGERFIRDRLWEEPPPPPKPPRGTLPNGLDKSARARSELDALLDIAGVKRHDDG